jgi:hypothetical protein
MSLLADGIVRPAGNLLRIASVSSGANQLEGEGQRLVRRALD